MENFSDSSQKGSVLMQQALKKYANGDFEGGDKDREEANRWFDLASKEINSEEGKLTQLYGESRNFGIIYNVFEQNINKLFSTKEGKKVIKEAYNLIKNNKVLNEQFKVYDLFEKSHDIDNTKDFVNEATGLITNIDKKTIKENNEKFIRFIRQNKLDEYVVIPEDTENLYEAIEYILLNKKSLNNVNEFVKAQNVIAEHIVKETEKKNKDEEDDPEPKKTDDLYKKDHNLWFQKWMAWSYRHPSVKKPSFERFKDNVEEAEEELEENINDDEKRLLDEFTNPNTDKKIVFETHKQKVLNAIDEARKTAHDKDKEQWDKTYDNIFSKNYSNIMAENIINCAEMMEVYSIIKN